MLDSAQRLWDRLGAWARRTVAAVLAAPGRHVPQHVAFIMDGNRRYAEARRLRRAEGHAHGYARLIDALEWCLELGVRCVSVYAFSIDNYRRSGDEVATLMTLAQQKLDHMLQEHAVLERHGVQVRILGDLRLAPPAVQAAAARVVQATAHHDRAVLNLCFSYTASEEMLQALDGGCAATASAPGSGSSGISSAASLEGTHGGASPAAEALDARLYTAGCPPVDLLVRTSGETRLSDFLLWQCRHALLVFTHVLWPDFGFLDLVAAVLQYQRHAPHLHRLRHAADAQAAAAVPEALAAATAAGKGLLPVLQPLKVSAARQRGSPCSVASPASPSSPSSRSEDAAPWEEDGGGTAAAELAAGSPLQAGRRHAAAAATRQRCVAAL